jgi:hypothetical protein
MDIGVPPAVTDLIGGGGESWKDRIREAAYVSPSKTRFRIEYEDLERTVTRRGTAYEFPGVNDAYVQQKGFGPRIYPMRCYFSGPNCDRIADAFLLALLEPGVGKLEHPRYGTIPRVVPFGDIGQRDDLKTSANQSVIDVTFWTTLVELYPSEQTSPKNEIEEALGDFDVAAAQAFASATALDTLAAQASLKGTIRSALREIRGALEDVSGSVASVRREFDDNFRLINEGLDVLVGQPLLLAQQIINLIRAPARAAAGIRSRLEGYANLAVRMFGSKAGRPQDFPVGVATSAITRRRNDAAVADLIAMAAVTGSVASSLENDFLTKPDAIKAADEVAAQFDDLVDWRDGVNEEVGAVDTGESYQALQQAVALTAGFLVEVSFRLIPERSLVIDQPTTIINLAARLYGRLDDTILDLLINSNRLTGSEILEIPRGRKILYYP